MNRDEVTTALTPISKPDSMLGLKLKERIEDTYDRCMRTKSDEATKQDCWTSSLRSGEILWKCQRR